MSARFGEDLRPIARDRRDFVAQQRTGDFDLRVEIERIAHVQVLKRGSRRHWGTAEGRAVIAGLQRAGQRFR
jgi:hypothetical protein